MTNIYEMYMAPVLIVVAVLGFLKYRGFCRHQWKPVETRFRFDSNVIEKTYICKKCGKVKREFRTHLRDDNPPSVILGKKKRKR